MSNDGIVKKSKQPKPEVMSPPDPQHALDCVLHADIDGLLSQCNAKTKDGSACKNRPQKSAYAHNTRNLPVCHAHRHSRPPLMGRCTATATCGKRCNRPYTWSQNYEHLCSRHNDSICYLNLLPVELRFTIIELLIPEGPIMVAPCRCKKACYLECETPYRSAAALARVNRELSQQVRAVLYQSAIHPCKLSINDDKISIMENTFKLNLATETTQRKSRKVPEPWAKPWSDPVFAPLSPPDMFTSQQTRSLFELHHQGLNRFSHFVLDFEAELPSKAKFPSELCLLMHAISSPGGGRVGNKPTVTLNIKLKRDIRQHPDPIEFVDDAVARCNQILRVMKPFDIHLQWCFSDWFATVARGTIPSARLTHTAAEDFTAIELIWRAHVAKSVQPRIQALLFLSWAKASKAGIASAVRRWQLYQRIVTTTRDMIVAGRMRNANSEYSTGTTRRLQDALMTLPLEHLELLSGKTDRCRTEFFAYERRKIDAFENYYTKESAFDLPETPGSLLMTKERFEKKSLDDLLQEVELELCPQWRTLLRRSYKNLERRNLNKAAMGDKRRDDKSRWCGYWNSVSASCSR